MVVVHFFDFYVVFCEQARDIRRFFDKLGGQIFGGFLRQIVAIEVIYAVLKGGGGDVVKKAGESLLFIMSEMPDDEGDADGMI